jgi:amino acid adenylation domain-containing protein
MAEFSSDLFDASSVQTLAQRLVTILGLLVDDTEISVGEIDLLRAGERADLLLARNDTDHDVDPVGLAALVSHQARRSPDATAVIFDDAALTYADLDAWSDALAGKLVGEGSGPGTIVGVSLPRSAELIVALLAVAKTGAAFLPLDPEYPPDRLAYMIDDAEPIAVLDDEAAVRAVRGGPTALSTVDPAWWAYVLYTSGTTGRPKGVAVPHAGIVNRISWLQHAYPLGVDDRMLVKTPISFDTSVWEVFWPLSVGATLVVARPGGHREPDYLVETIVSQHVTAVDFVPSMLVLFLDEPRSVECTSLTRVTVGGEALSMELANRFSVALGVPLHNLYGPTEASVDVLGWTADGGPVALGVPGWNVRAYVLDAYLNPVPDDARGELYLAGVQLADGYLRRCVLTAERFVANPFEHGTRMYRTGDVVRWRHDRQLEYLGRIDDQIKLRGVRIEPGEIEKVLADHPGIASARVVVRGNRLVAYYLAAPGDDATAEGLRRHATSALPIHMIPSAFVQLAEFPLTPSGKLDRSALPEPELITGVGRLPETAEQQELCELFSDVLGVAVTSIDDDFFSLGGHSLLSIRLVNRMRDALGVELSIRDVFDAPTVAALAERVESHPAGTTVRPVLVAAERPARIPVSPAQERLLILDRLGETGAAYNYPLVFHVRGAVDLEALDAALGDLLDRHESLRTVFVDDEGELFQRILPVGTRVPTEVLDSDESRLTGQLAAAAARTFDLSTEIPLRVSVFRCGTDDYTVALLLHHIATDEWSDTPFIADLNRAYQSRAAGGATPLPPLPVQYADYALWQRELLARVGDHQRAFWRTALAGVPDEMSLPTDRPRPSLPTGAGGTLQVDLSAETAAALRELTAQRQVSMLMTLHAAVAALLHRLGAGDDIVVGTPVAGRDEAALNEVVGFFVNTVVLRADVSRNPSFDELLSRIRPTDLAAFAHQELPFDWLVEELKPPRVAGRNPLFNVFIGAHRGDGDDAEMFGLPTRWRETQVTTAMFDLGFTLIDEGADKQATILAEYSSDLFDESSVRTLVHRLVMIFDQIASDTTISVAELELLRADERDDLLVVRNDTGQDDVSGGLAALVSGQALRTPDATAVVFDDFELSFADLDAWSDGLAAALADGGAGPGAVVGVSLQRSVELVVALLAVAKSGAAFLPLDLDYPSDRLAYMIDDAKPAAVLDDMAVVRAARVGNGSWQRCEVDPATRAYVLYTSGTTGRPKGVAVPHAGIVNRIAWLQHAYPLAAGDRMLVKTPVGFDTSVWEVFWPLSVGATLVVARPGGHRDPRYLAEVIVSQQVTAVDFVPSMLELFLDEPRSALCTSLTRVTVGGEALPTDLANRFAAALDVLLHNLYGPTEASVDVLGWTADGGAVALGLPGWNVKVYVLDAYLNPVPAGVPGELYLAGVQLADGYLHRYDLTAQAFVANPFATGARMYRTGDLVRWRNDGQLDYLGRTDEQIKLRGVRMEPGEIETVLSTHPSVSSARVIVRHDRLVAYYLTAAAEAVSTESLRSHATATLPSHMIPSAFVELTEFPLTPSGKLDRNALPEPELIISAGRTPETAEQQRLCEVFGDILGVTVTSIDDDFFTLGGHSLLLVKLAASIRREFDVELPVAELMTSSTVAEVAERLAGDVGGDSFATVLALRTSGSEPPLFCVHPASGLSWQYVNLKRHLPQSIPLYGLQSPLFSGGELPETLGELAANYADTVCAIAPSGPIRLLGWSFGGVVALLIAQEINRRGREVGFVGMLDSYPEVMEVDSFDSEAVLGGLLREMGFPVDADTRMTVADAVELMHSSDDAIAILDDAQIALAVESYLAAERFSMGASYGRYGGDVFFVDATVDVDRLGISSQAWHEHVGGELRVVEVDCRHSELMDANTLERLGPIIAAELAR